MHATTTIGRGFTLTEIAIAMGLAAFCLVAILGLLPAGMNSNRETLEQTQAAALASTVEDDLRALGSLTNATAASPRFGLLLEPASPMQSLFVGEDGSPTSVGAARYRITVRGPKSIAGTTRGPLAANVLVTWPAVADPDAASWPTNATGRMESLVLIPVP